MRCADSLLRGLMHKSHEHKLFYVVPDRDNLKLRFERCSVCFDDVYGRPYYHCADSGCDRKFHLKCLGIPKYVVKKSYHIHPLVGRKYLPEDNSLEYCGVCETMLYAGHHAYCCKECDFVGHIECIINEEAPCPLYLKDLYFCGEDVTILAHQDKHEIMELEKKPVVIDISHNHVLTFVDTEAYFEHCSICSRYIDGTYWECKPRELKSDAYGFSTHNPCVFRAHDNCLKLGQPSEHRFHLNHLLTLLPSYPAGILMNCDVCKGEISSFNLFCRICNFIICTKCVVKANQFLGELQRGQKFIRYEEGRCLKRCHGLAQVMVSMSYQVACTICNDRLCGNLVSCVECKEIYHSRCVELERLELVNHPLHFDHTLECELKSGSKCIACKQDVTAYAYFCFTCSVSFHLKCIEAVGIARKVENHKHYLYHFWSSSTRPCTVCSRPCRQSFYGCNKCNFSAHVQCIGFPDYVKNQRHQHIVRLIYASDEKNCSLCESECGGNDNLYACKLCKEFFHKECIMSMAEREAATEEEQINDIYLMYIERDLVKFIYLLKHPEEVLLDNTDINEEDSDYSC